MQESTYRDFITQLLASASAIVLDNFGKVSGTTKAGDPNQVLTVTDLRIGRLVIDEIKRRFPGHNIVDEETGVLHNGSPYTWVVDPIDGTSNFAAGVPLFGIMLGLLHANTPIAGGIALPVFDMICTAVKGEGAWCGTERIAVSTADRLRDSLVAYGIDSSPNNPYATKKECAFLGELVSRIRNLRSSNSAFDVVMVAQGKYGAFLNRTSKIWDIVAPHIIVEEAGGLYTTFDGKPIDYTEPTRKAGANFTVCAAAPILHRELQALLAFQEATQHD
jgi:myo-inositol-1(or 4)-monophosphatase